MNLCWNIIIEVSTNSAKLSVLLYIFDKKRFHYGLRHTLPVSSRRIYFVSSKIKLDVGKRKILHLLNKIKHLILAFAYSLIKYRFYKRHYLGINNQGVIALFSARKVKKNRYFSNNVLAISMLAYPVIDSTLASVRELEKSKANSIVIEARARISVLLHINGYAI